MLQEPMAFDQALGALRQFRGMRQSSARALEHCELCGAQLHQDHPHLVELASLQLLCACDACAMLFDGMERSKFKRVSRRIQFLSDFAITDSDWDSLIIPINLAFFFSSSIEDRTIVLYPSPAGAVESLLPLGTWNAIVESNPVLQELHSDIEALLVNRIRRTSDDRSAQYFIAPIDECYRLVGLIRANWKGLSGGAEAWDAIDRFFADLRSRAEIVNGGVHA